MCGRFTNEMTWSELHALYKLSDEMFPVAPHNMQPRYNIAPTQDVDFVRLDKTGNMELDRGRWWLVPFFAKELPKAECSMPASKQWTRQAHSGGASNPGAASSPPMAILNGRRTLMTGRKTHGCCSYRMAKVSASPAYGQRNDNLGVTSCTRQRRTAATPSAAWRAVAISPQPSRAASPDRLATSGLEFRRLPSPNDEGRHDTNLRVDRRRGRDCT